MSRDRMHDFQSPIFEKARPRILKASIPSRLKATLQKRKLLTTTIATTATEDPVPGRRRTLASSYKEGESHKTTMTYGKVPFTHHGHYLEVERG